MHACGRRCGRPSDAAGDLAAAAARAGGALADRRAQGGGAHLEEGVLCGRLHLEGEPREQEAAAGGAAVTELERGPSWWRQLVEAAGTHQSRFRGQPGGSSSRPSKTRWLPAVVRAVRWRRGDRVWQEPCREVGGGWALCFAKRDSDQHDAAHPQNGIEHSLRLDATVVHGLRLLWNRMLALVATWLHAYMKSGKCTHSCASTQRDWHWCLEGTCQI
jgi:hypothetical protein